MKLYQLIFRGGRVQTLMADRYSRNKSTIHFRTGRTTLEFPAVDLIMIDELADEGMTQTAGMGGTFGLRTALG